MCEVVEALDELVDKLWYGRHQVLAKAIEDGRTRVVEQGKEIDPLGFPRPIHSDIWAGAQRAARMIEEQHGLATLGPCSDFGWGLLNGKVSALRWALGEDWDMLDT